MVTWCTWGLSGQTSVAWVEWEEVTGHEVANVGWEEDGSRSELGIQTVVLSSS